jgi:hypothetical protein
VTAPEESVELYKAQQEASLELYKAQQQANLDQYRAQQQAKLEVFKTVIQSGQAALRTALVINGGAAVALLAFIGNLWSQLSQPGTTPSAVAVIADLARSMLSFTGGVWLAAIATGTTYLTQLAYQDDRETTAKWLRGLTIVLVVAALGAFGWGVWLALRTFTTLPSR